MSVRQGETSRDQTISHEKKHLSPVLVSNGYPSSFVHNITKARTAPRKEPVAEFKSTSVLPYVQGVSEPLRHCLKQQGVRIVFKVYIGETGRSMQERIKEHDRDIRLAGTQTSAVSEHAHETLWNEVKFIDRDSHW